MTTKNLILGYATNSRFEDYYRFITSLHRACSPNETDVAIFIDDLGDEFAQAAIEHRVTLVPVVNVFKFARRSKILNLVYHANFAWLSLLGRFSPAGQRPWIRSARWNMVAEWIHPQAGRWMFFDAYLRVNSAYRAVMTSDVRDVIFQASPFEGVDVDHLHVFREDGCRFGDDNLNTTWHRAVFGSPGTDRLAGRTALCSGTVIGGVAPFRHFLARMAEEISFYPRIPLDQAIFNEVVYRKLDPALVVSHSLSDGPVLTLVGDHQSLWTIRDGQVEIGGRPAPVVHMYDRCRATEELFHAMLPVPRKAQERLPSPDATGVASG